MRKTTLHIIFFCLLAVSVTAPITGNDGYNTETRFHADRYSSENGSLPYRLLTPPRIRAGSRYPLILFLHGINERGNDNRRHLNVGLHIFASERMISPYPCYIAAPQCPLGDMWTPIQLDPDKIHLYEKPNTSLLLAIELVDHLARTFPVDRNRIYVTGYSMGGFGTWEVIMRRPDLFAAAVPICGGGDLTLADRISHLPVWVFHGRKDRKVPVELSRRMVYNLLEAGGLPLYTEYPGYGHFCWGYAYSNPLLLRWLFAQRKR